jgi:hypothetical protein
MVVEPKLIRWIASKNILEGKANMARPKFVE